MRTKHCIPTAYNGQEFRSRFEARIAFWLDALNIMWEYEPKSFILKSGVLIWPDFYLPELKTWLEVKGIFEESDEKNFKDFAREYDTEAIIISPIHCLWFAGDGVEHLQMGKCKACGRYYFCGDYGTYTCRGCRSYEGDHYLKFDEVDILYQIHSLLKSTSLGEVVLGHYRP